MGGCTDFSYYDVTIKAAIEFGVGTFKAYKAVFFTMIDPMTRSTSPNYPKNKIDKFLWRKTQNRSLTNLRFLENHTSVID